MNAARFTGIASPIPMLPRDGETRSVDATLGQITENPNQLLDGVDVVTLAPEMRRRLGLNDPRVKGVVISEVAGDSPFRDRLAPNMVILEVNRVPVADLRSAREALQPGRNLLAIYDRGQVRFIVVTIR